MKDIKGCKYFCSTDGQKVFCHWNNDNVYMDDCGKEMCEAYRETRMYDSKDKGCCDEKCPHKIPSYCTLYDEKLSGENGQTRCGECYSNYYD